MTQPQDPSSQIVQAAVAAAQANDAQAALAVCKQIEQMVSQADPAAGQPGGASGGDPSAMAPPPTAPAGGGEPQQFGKGGLVPDKPVKFNFVK